MNRWQRHWVLIKATGSDPNSTTGTTRAAIWEAETTSDSAATSTYPVNRAIWPSQICPFSYLPLLLSAPPEIRPYEIAGVVLTINKGCGGKRNCVALGQFAAYVQQQWSAMHEEDTTCDFCGQQFLPSLIEEHQERCESKGHLGDILDYLKDETNLYTRIKKGDYTLRAEPKLFATGEARMGLVLVKEATCNSCGLHFPANELEHHRRWDCKWTKVAAADGHEGVLRRSGLLAPSQELGLFKKEVEFTSML